MSVCLCLSVCLFLSVCLSLSLSLSLSVCLSVCLFRVVSTRFPLDALPGTAITKPATDDVPLLGAPIPTAVSWGLWGGGGLNAYAPHPTPQFPLHPTYTTRTSLTTENKHKNTRLLGALSVVILRETFSLVSSVLNSV